MNREDAVRYAVEAQKRTCDAKEKAFLIRAEDALREQIRGEWIPVAVRLPQDSRPVLITDGRQIYRGYYDHVHRCWRTTKTISITHWRRMPGLPERQK